MNSVPAFKGTHFCINVQARGKVLRRQKGSVLSEFGPALFILLVFALFPMVDLIYMGLAYATCANLNSLQLREVARTPASQAMGAAADVTCQWKASIVGKLANFSSDPSVNISYGFGEANGNGKDIYVALTTSSYVRPLLNIPFFGKVPGLAAPMNLNITSQRLLENPRYATE